MNKLYKPVFVLFPHSIKQEDVVFELIQNEVKAYLIRSIADSYKIFQEYPEAYLFVNIEPWASRMACDAIFSEAINSSWFV